MKTVFHLCFVTSLRQLTPVLILVLVLVLPFVFTEFTNYTVDPDVKALARIQAAWQVSWVVGLLWSLFYSAHTGAHHVQSRMGEYFQSAGISKGTQLIGIWASSMCYIAVIALIPFLLTTFTMLGADAEKNGHWLVLAFQHFAFMLIVLSGVNYLAAAVGSRLGATIGYAGAVVVSFAGIYFVPLLKKLVAGSDFFVLDVLYVILPHFYLADLTHRFIHHQGALSTSEFFVIFEYLAGWSLIFSAVAHLVFTPKEK